MMVRTCRCPRQQGDQTISQLVGGGGGRGSVLHVEYQTYSCSTWHGNEPGYKPVCVQRLEVVYISSTSSAKQRTVVGYPFVKSGYSL